MQELESISNDFPLFLSDGYGSIGREEGLTIRLLIVQFNNAQTEPGEIPLCVLLLIDEAEVIQARCS